MTYPGLKAYTLVLCCFFFYSNSFAQGDEKNITHRSITWLGYFNTINLSSKWLITSDIGERFYLDNGKQAQFLVRSKVNYVLGQNWDAGVGFAFFKTWTADPASTSTLGVPELRPFQEFNNRQRFNKVSLRHRFRIEERFFRKTANGELADGYNFNFRFRYMFSADYNIYTSANKKQSVSLRAADEIMMNAGKNVVYNMLDQNRIYGGVIYQPVNNLGLELGYMYIIQSRNAPKQYVHFDVLRFTIHHSID